MDQAIEADLREYQEILEAMANSRIDAGGAPKQWNRLVDRNQLIQLRLRESAEGQAGISQLMGHPDSTVQLWAASHAISWDEPRARTVLEALRDKEGFVGFEAKITLREFDAGRLRSDWVPKG